jgi:hypothetical protein
MTLASPYFESVIEGGWKETAPRQPQVRADAERRSSFTTAVSDATSIDEEPVPEEDSLSRTPIAAPLTASATASAFAASMVSSYLSRDHEEDDDDLDDDTIICRLKLKEEKASSFQDLLFHVYPRLECLISWQNAEDLFGPRISALGCG